MPQPLSAADAISPAWRYAGQYLSSQPRNLTVLKICAVAFLAEMGGFSFNYSQPLHHGSAPSPFHALLVELLATLAVIAVALSLLFFYLGSRFQFVLFELVLRRDTLVAPIWNRYGAKTWRWMGIKFVFSLVLSLLASTIASPFIIYFVLHFKRGAEINGSFIAMIIAAVLFGLALIIAWAAIHSVLTCFAVPVMAFESTNAMDTVQRVWAMFLAAPGSVSLFVLLRVLLAMGCVLGAESLLALGGAIVAIPFVIIGKLAWSFLYGSGVAAEVVLGIILMLLVSTFVAAFFIAALRAFGQIYVFLQAYTLFYLTRRYPPVDGYIEPFMPITYVPPPAWEPPPLTPQPEA